MFYHHKFFSTFEVDLSLQETLARENVLHMHEFLYRGELLYQVCIYNKREYYYSM